MKKGKQELPSKTEEQNLDVFGTKEVSVAEFMGSTDKNLILLSSPKLAKENLIALKEKHEKRAEELIAIEKLSPAELKELNSIRGELREPRYLVQKIQTNNTSVFESYKKTDKANLSELIEINKSLEDKVDEKIKLEDERKKKEKEDEKNAEAFREQTIRDKIDLLESASYEIIQKMTYSEIISKTDELERLEDTEFDYAEFDILLDQTKDRIAISLETKIETLTQAENQRLDNIRLEQENAEAKRKSDLQANRLTEIMPYVSFGVAVDLTKLSELTDENYTKILKGKKELFDADVLEKQQADDARKEKEAEEKEAVLIIRRNRLNEIGFNFAAFQGFNHRVFPNVKVNSEEVYAASTVEFENILVEAKKSIEGEQIKIDLFEERKKALTDVGMLVEDFGVNFKVSDNKYFTVEKYQIIESNPEQFSAILIQAKEAFIERRTSFVTALGYVHNPKTRNFELKGFDSYSDDFLDYKFEFFHEKVEEIKLHIQQRNEDLSKADAEKLKSENKERNKRLKSDKKALTDFVKSLEFRTPVPELQNEDMQPILDNILLELENTRGLLLTSINLF